MTARKDQESHFEAALNEVRRDQPDPEQAAAAAQRVRELLFSGQAGAGIRGCGDFQLLLPAYRAGELAPQQALLLEDHLCHCLVCRRVSRPVEQVIPKPGRLVRESASRGVAWKKWAGLAAAVVVGLFLLQVLLPGGWLPGRAQAWAVLESSDGPVYRVSEAGAQEIRPGERVEEGETVRTARLGRAFFRLADRSRIEAAPRSQFTFLGGWLRREVVLDRGQVIVEASDQGGRRLQVETAACSVAVQGTVFSVTHGLSGSRVSVVEGSVLVRQGSGETRLTAGQQFSSDPRLRNISVAQDIAWSGNLEEHLTLLHGFSALQREIQKITLSEELRYSSSLSGLLPENTVVYAAFPNLSARLDEIRELFLRKLEENPALRQWHDRRSAGPGPGPDQLLEKVGAMGAYLGPEIVAAGVQSDSSRPPEFLVVAAVTDKDALKSLILRELERREAESSEGPAVFLFEDPSEAPAGEGIYILLRADLLVLSPRPDLIAEVDHAHRSGGSSFASSSFHQTLAGAYQDGVDWIFAADLERFVTAAAGESKPFLLNALGVQRLMSVIAEREQTSGSVQSHALLSYEESGAGVSSWLAPPGPLGGLEFVTPEAQLVGAFVISNPVQLVDNVLQYLQTFDAEKWGELLQFEAEHAISLREDLAAPLGGEIVVALDGPILPDPSWKVIMEVYDAARLQRTIEQLVREFNSHPERSADEVLEIKSETAGGIPIYSVGPLGSEPPLHYLYTQGFLIAAANRPLLGQALQAQQSGYRLAASSRFSSLLPGDARISPSGLLYGNVADTVDPLLQSGAGAALPALTPAQQAVLAKLVEDSEPALISFYTQPGRLTLKAAGEPERMWMHLGLLSALGRQGGEVKEQ